MVFHYIYRFSITAWRRKTALIIGIALLVIITAGIHFSKTSSELIQTKEERSSAIVQQLVQSNAEGVKFVENSNYNRKYTKNPDKQTTDLNLESLGKLEQPSRDEIAARRASAQEYNDGVVDREIEQQMGVPFVNLDPKKPYIPQKRLVHFDLKGAPLKVSYFKRIFPLLKTMGATGILLGT